MLRIDIWAGNFCRGSAGGLPITQQALELALLIFIYICCLANTVISYINENSFQKARSIQL